MPCLNGSELVGFEEYVKVDVGQRELSEELVKEDGYLVEVVGRRVQVTEVDQAVGHRQAG